jgi:proline dehydrogenase
MIDFSNTETAFKMKTNMDLKQSQLLFSTLSSPSIVNLLKSLTMASLKCRLPIKGIVKATVFRQFCGGETVEECDAQIRRLAQGNVSAILDYSVEGKAQEADFDRTLQTTLHTLEHAKTHPFIPFGVFKPTGLGSIELYEKVSKNEKLSDQEQATWDRVVKRWKTIFDKADTLRVRVMVDAEESWIQPAVDELVINFMRQYNRQTAIVYNTAQMYRHDRLKQLEDALELAKEEGFKYGVKIVRGAYMEKERARAAELGYEDPIQPNKAASDRDYNAALHLSITNLDHMAVVIGTHNEDSVELASSLMKKLMINLNDERIYIAQLFGMSDHISFNASAAGMNVAKYLPFGPVKDVLPYLFRRAEENTSVEGQTGRELGLIQKEVRRRKG